ncbi:hypothetical protein SAICODRAFT_20453 [Saitoella complicata NRRL Y-17804]|uniref:uncharacterized protein n=1 Tax=Saitoella complicata (strain BCRC 22490 / CBS 7301 / JCM 7358 / NBRC 10748 / NRRL Y-17804) TaxID=698492 RepID=UPI00086725EB|nr:uncharacterized protein SAICODRAFT_20453 [Saitoella complicata NRRL Y-17804]ODQ51799.1 hypothetical protein SAICODRAFT_20453 [Saitoella complicata NRRL Y-17804]
MPAPIQTKEQQDLLSALQSLNEAETAATDIEGKLDAIHGKLDELLRSLEAKGSLPSDGDVAQNGNGAGREEAGKVDGKKK